MIDYLLRALFFLVVLAVSIPLTLVALSLISYCLSSGWYYGRLFGQKQFMDRYGWTYPQNDEKEE